MKSKMGAKTSAVPAKKLDRVSHAAHERAAFARGVELFNARRFFDAHEVWEEIWLPATGLEKRLLQGLIQIAAAFHHHSRGNLLGTESLLRAGAAKLKDAPHPYREIHARRICLHARRWTALLEKKRDVSARRPPRIEPALPTRRKKHGIAKRTRGVLPRKRAPR
jgi:uncharacterized protein